MQAAHCACAYLHMFGEGQLTSAMLVLQTVSNRATRTAVDFQTLVCFQYKPTSSSERTSMGCLVACWNTQERYAVEVTQLTA